MVEVQSFQGTVGVGLRELNKEEYYTLCFDKSYFNKTVQSLANQPLNFTSDFGLRIFTSGCYYYDLNSNKWTSNGVEILPDSSISLAHCISYHLTEFAGGFLVLPSSIDFNKVWANAGFLQNPIIYSTVIIIISLYIIFACFSRLLDYKDSKKITFSIIDNLSENYLYELRIFTGSRKGAETNSNVIKFTTPVFKRIKILIFTLTGEIFSARRI